jgi:hypothetical protein
MGVGLSAGALLAGCADDGLAGPTGAARPSIAETPPASTERVLPAGELAAVPLRNRGDSAKHIFQIEIVNGTTETFYVKGLSFEWAGFTTPLVPRDDHVPPGRRIDFPMPFVGANCVGDGSLASMPDLGDAAVVLTLDGGLTRPALVVDVHDVARDIYLDDCERQHVEALVALEFAGLHTVQVDGYSTTVGQLHIERRQSTGTVRLMAVGNTINFSFHAVDAASGGVVASLPGDRDEIDVPIHITEGRCDFHAIADSQEPFNFVLQVDPGDGVVRPYLLLPAERDRQPMFDMVRTRCAELSKLQPLGDGSTDGG